MPKSTIEELLDSLSASKKIKVTEDAIIIAQPEEKQKKYNNHHSEADEVEIEEEKLSPEELAKRIMENQIRKKDREKEEKIIIKRAILLYRQTLQLTHNDIALAINSLAIVKNNLLNKMEKDTQINLRALELAIEWLDRSLTKQKSEFPVSPTSKETQNIKKLGSKKVTF